jgi:hypothetical protein
VRRSQSGERRVVRPWSPPAAIQDLITRDTSSMYSTGIRTRHTCAKNNSLKVHKIENFFGSDFEFCVISLLVMLKY